MKCLKYIDFFGIHFHFYIGNKRKLYTSYGGVISIIYMIFCFCIFFILTLKDILHKNPISNMSSISQAGYHKVRFKEERFWLPWRIVDPDKKFVDFSDKLEPKIFNIKGVKNNKDSIFSFKKETILYKLCNETDFAQIGNHHYIDVNLSEIYCMDYDTIELGGGWTTDFLNYIQLDIICKESSDEINESCSDHKWAIEYFYPIVEYQPTNYENPILVIYKNHFYNFTKFLNKEERLYFQEYVFNDDKGYIFNDDLNSSFWGYISSDFDVLHSDDHVNEELYSLNIYLDSGKILYARRYNKIYTIIANVFPIFNAIFFIFDYLTYMVKTIMTEKYLSELFFQRINENDKLELNTDKRKSTNFFYRNYKLNLSMHKRDNNYMMGSHKGKKKDKNLYDRNKNNKNYNSNIINDINKEENKNNLTSNYNNHNNNDEIKKNNYNNNTNISNNNSLNNNGNNNRNHKVKNSLFDTSKKSSIKTNNISNLEKCNNKLKDLLSHRIISKNNNDNNSHNNSSFDVFSSPKLNNYMELNYRNMNSAKSVFNKRRIINENNQVMNEEMVNIDLEHKNVVKTGYEDKNNVDEVENSFNYSHFNFHRNRGFNNSAIITRFRLKGSLFSMKDYICSFCIKDIKKEYKYLSNEYSAIFNFLSDIYDVTSYLQLYRQFHILSGFLLDNVVNININHKININNKELFEQIICKNKNVFYFSLKDQFNNADNNK
jgi:hypothetical protein